MSKLINIPRRLPKEWRNIEEPGKSEMNRRERDAMWRIEAVQFLCDEDGEKLKDRLRMANALSLYRSGVGLMTKALKKVCETIPTWQLAALEDNVNHSELIIRPSGVLKQHDIRIMRHDDAQMLYAMAIKHECGMCLKTEAQISKCQLRKVLMRIQPPETLTTHGCGYMREQSIAGGIMDDMED